MISTGKNTAAATDAKFSRLSASWSAALQGTAYELGVISRSTEDEFLAIGAKLQEFYQRGGAISSLATEIVGEVAGERVAEAMQRLAEMLDEMERYVNRARGEIETSALTLREILTLLDKVAGPLSGFKKVNKVLRMLGISTKIESARLGQSAAGFDTLASDVGDLSVQVNEKAAVIIKRKDDLAAAIRQTLNGVLESGAQQHGQVISTLGKTRESLRELDGINMRCSDSAAEVSATSAEVSGSIGEVVMSMQAHDIVRQQIEHVEQALADLGSGLGSGLAGADDAASICELQSAQLRHASAALESAVRSIIDSLRQIASKQGVLSAQTSGMSGRGDQSGASFFSDMENDISAMSERLLESSHVNSNLCEAMASVAATVGEIASFVADIERIGEEIKLIALNAQIKSAYTGDEGAALGVLAEAIQRLSIDAIDQTGAVSEILQSILAVTERLTAGASAGGCGLESEVTTIVSTLSSLLEVLRGVKERVSASLARMDDEARLLSGDIEEVAAGITVHARVTGVLGQAVEVLSGIISEGRRIAPAAAQGENFSELASRYTMQSERNIHEALIDPAAAMAAPSPGCDDGMGDNVELF
jgi:methyl-accepting chemotaxis protein